MNRERRKEEIIARRVGRTLIRKTRRSVRNKYRIRERGVKECKELEAL